MYRNVGEIAAKLRDFQPPYFNEFQTTLHALQCTYRLTASQYVCVHAAEYCWNRVIQKELNHLEKHSFFPANQLPRFSRLELIDISMYRWSSEKAHICMIMNVWTVCIKGQASPATPQSVSISTFLLKRGRVIVFAYRVLTLQACVFALFISAHTIMAALTLKFVFHSCLKHSH